MPATISELSKQVQTGALSLVELTNAGLVRIEKSAALNAFITVSADSALNQARHAEDEIRRGAWHGPLHGIPISLKDLIDVAGVPTTAASAVFQGRVPGQDSEVVRRLKNAGAILIGKNNLHECAYGGSSLISHYGPVRNPWNLDRMAGGSSGGSAAAVAAGLVNGAIGTDTAGSIREPAALCGVVGLKPTYGRVSARGVMPLSQSLDHIGPIARTVADAAAILQIIAGHDPGDPTSVDAPVTDFPSALNESAKPLRIGVPRPYFFDDLDPEVASAVEWALSALAAMGHRIEDIELEVPTDRTLSSAEAYNNHAEFIARSPALYHAETLRRLLAGANTSQEEIADRRRELAELRRQSAAIFEHVDLLVTPATPQPAPLISDLLADLDQLRPRELTLLRNTRPFNVWGVPAVSVPCGFTESGLPIGLQIAGPHWQEARVLQLAHTYEQSTAWHKRQPPLVHLDRRS